MKRRKMLPEYQKLKDENGLIDKGPVFTISFSRFSLITVSLPLFSFIFCVSYSLLFFFEQSTSTHCHVWNYLPSISAAIGSFQPQAFVWQISIIVHFIPRLIITWMYKSYYDRVIRRNRQNVAKFALLLNVVENFSLLGLSIYTSNDNYEIHKNCFCTFIVVSETYMMLSYYLNKNAKRDPKSSHSENKSINLKRNLFIINITSIVLAAYFFVRHNDRCEGGIYTFFALFEYIVVLTNMGYHMTAAIDFHNQHLVFDWHHGLQIHFQ
ncbi:CLUMA_CG013678, isoform A [Clunio marinus]|uniref:CLUMA_CG013678, isoform A n=1 Tax=Clunio marinus TaxID=568069 RepID=A0A1J1IJK0_9DIPT|nr:CLUMA_CG013678, isoform A [Clunio marinus]